MKILKALITTLFVLGLMGVLLIWAIIAVLFI